MIEGASPDDGEGEGQKDDISKSSSIHEWLRLRFRELQRQSENLGPADPQAC